MKIAFITTQSLEGSTVIGRVLPIAKELTKNHEVHVLTHKGSNQPSDSRFQIHTIGLDPFIRTKSGKRRMNGFRLISTMKINALRTLFALIRIKPDVAIIVKPLPQNVLAAWLYQAINRKTTFILDVDDFELTANKLTSIWQRAAIHWSERTGAKMVDKIITVTPFLQDHFRQLAAQHKQVELILTGINPPALLDTEYHAPTGGPNTKCLLYIGSASITSGHRVDLLPDILTLVKKEIPNTKLIIAGSGDDIAQLKKQFAAKNLTDSVEWFGRFTSSDIPGLIEKSSILIDPIDGSISNRAKGSFRTALATATQTPIVTSDIGVRPMLLPQEMHNSSFANPEDAPDYAEKIVARLNKPLSNEQKQTMREHAMRYTWNKLAQQYEQVITTSLSSS